MTIVLALFATQGVLGAFDTLYYHEYRARLPSRPEAVPELRLHGARSVIYSVLFGTLPWVTWMGLWAWVLAALVLAEILITLADFVVEDDVRAGLGGVYAGERVSHAIMAIIYGAALGYLVPQWWQWLSEPTGFASTPGVPWLLRMVVTAMAAGVFLSGVRDLVAAMTLSRGDAR